MRTFGVLTIYQLLIFFFLFSFSFFSLFFIVGVNGLEVRIMADALVNYFRHLLRRALTDLLSKTNSVKGAMNQNQSQVRTYAYVYVCMYVCVCTYVLMCACM